MAIPSQKIAFVVVSSAQGTLILNRLDYNVAGSAAYGVGIQLLENAPPAPATCVRPTMPQASYPNVMGRPQLSAISRAMADILAMSFACDQTRVFFDMFSQPVGNPLYPNATEGHHQFGVAGDLFPAWHRR